MCIRDSSTTRESSKNNITGEEITSGDIYLKKELVAEITSQFNSLRQPFLIPVEEDAGNVTSDVSKVNSTVISTLYIHYTLSFLSVS